MNILAMIFPGQASQKVGMLSELQGNDVLKETFNVASKVLGYDLWNLIQSGPETELNKTYRAQPAILAASVAMWEIWRERGGKTPNFMAGHSLGEYSALVCSGVVDFSSAIRLVELRGIFMQEAVSEDCCAMSAILGLDENLVISVCNEATCNSQHVSLSVFNAPNYVVISGHKEAVERVNFICKQLGANFVFILPISVPSHCILMMPAVKKFENELMKIKFSTPFISVINNVDVCIEKDPDRIKQALIRQIYMPVRWKEIVEYLVKCNVDLLIEMGPGRILSTIVKRIIGNNLLSLSVHDIFLKDKLSINCYLR